MYPKMFAEKVTGKTSSSTTPEINCSMFFTWARERNKMKNHRAYIGPGAVEPITEDKIAVDVKFDPKNTKITYRSLWWDS